MGPASGAFETIVACITGPVWGQGAIAGVRISGSEAIPIARNVFPALPANPETHKAVYGVFIHGDDGLALPFLGTASYTGEPTVEFFVHGSPASVQLLIEACLKYGARIAEPGEFTSRAFLNGKMDLTQAEAVAELIAARTESHLKAAQNQRQGALSRAVRNAWQPLTAVIVALEAWLDFSEEIGDLDPNSLITQLESSRTATRTCMANGLGSQWIRDGLRVALLGKPNAGKSSLFNRLVGSDRAIVTDIPGTTRDVLEHTVIHRGILLRFLDTAGLRQTEDLVEKIGVERSHEAFEQADLRLYLCEDPLDPDLEIWRKRPRTLTVITKGDLQNSPSTQDLQISVETNEGIEQLLDWLANHYSSVEPPYLLNIRHTELLQEAEEELALAIKSLQAQEPAELTLAPLRAAERALRQIIGISEGSISGEGVGPDLLSAIFSRFCIGK